MMSGNSSIEPRFIHTPSNTIEVDEGQPVELSCCVLAKPRAEFSWQKDGKEMTLKARYSILDLVDKCKLVINPSSTLDTGQFTCTAVNPVGQASCSVQVKVMERDTTPAKNPFPRSILKPCIKRQSTLEELSSNGPLYRTNTVVFSPPPLRSVQSIDRDSQLINRISLDAESANHSPPPVYLRHNLRPTEASHTPQCKSPLETEKEVNPFDYWTQKEKIVRAEVVSTRRLSGPAPRQHHLSICLQPPPLNSVEDHVCETLNASDDWAEKDTEEVDFSLEEMSAHPDVVNLEVTESQHDTVDKDNIHRGADLELCQEGSEENQESHLSSSNVSGARANSPVTSEYRVSNDTLPHVGDIPATSSVTSEHRVSNDSLPRVNDVTATSSVTSEHRVSNDSLPLVDDTLATSSVTSENRVSNDSLPRVNDVTSTSLVTPEHRVSNDSLPRVNDVTATPLVTPEHHVSSDVITTSPVASEHHVSSDVRTSSPVTPEHRASNDSIPRASDDSGFGQNSSSEWVEPNKPTVRRDIRTPGSLSIDKTPRQVRWEKAKSWAIHDNQSNGLRQDSVTSENWCSPPDDLEVSWTSDLSPPTEEFTHPFPPRDVEIQVKVDPEPLFDWFDQVGSGRFGKVFRCRDKCEGADTVDLAAKAVRYRRSDRADVIREVDIMRTLSGHPQLIGLHSVFDTGRKIYIIMEFVAGGELFDRIAQEEQLTEDQVAGFVRQILLGVEYIHSKKIIHRDLKPENIMCRNSNSYHIKIIDLGLADYYDSERPPKRMVGTTLFVSPEVLQFEPQGFYTDIWSIGVITYDLLAGITPFEIPRDGDRSRELNEHEILVNIERCQFDFDDEGFTATSDQAKDFIRAILVKKPGLRPSASDCLNHDWFKQRGRPKVKRHVSIQRMKHFVASRKWHKVQLALRAIQYMKAGVFKAAHK